MQRSSQRPLLDHLVRSGQQRFRDGEAERLGGLEVDEQFDFGGLVDRQALYGALEVKHLFSRILHFIHFLHFLHFLHTSFFVRLGIPFLRPDPHVLEAGAHRGCQGRPSLYPGHTLPRFQAAP